MSEATGGQERMKAELTKRVAVSIESARHKPGERASVAQANAALDSIGAWLYDHGHVVAAARLAGERKQSQSGDSR